MVRNYDVKIISGLDNKSGWDAEIKEEELLIIQ